MSKTISTNDPNLYFELSNRFYLEVPLLRQVKDKEGNLKQAYCPCVVLSQWEEQKCKTKAEQETLAEFNGVRPKENEFSNWKTIYEDSFNAHIVYNSFRCPNDLDKPLFMNKKSITEEYSSHELSVHGLNYTTTVLNQPYMKHLQQNDKKGYSEMLDTIISHATDTQTAFFLGSYTTLSLAVLLRSSAVELKKLLLDSGSSGTL